MISDLPKDLLEEILSRVPATSHKQLRSTCKLWNRLFNNERFTKKHFEKAPKQIRTLMLKKHRVCSMSVNLHGTDPAVEFTGELSLINPLSRLDQLEITRVSHCDGLLLCTNLMDNIVVVWNPCTGQTMWIQPRIRYATYALGSYKDNKHRGNSYKILSYGNDCDENNKELAIYEINSNSWRTLDVTLDFLLLYLHYLDDCVSLKGNTYLFGSDKKDEGNQLGMFLVSFDYTTERFGRIPLPRKCPAYERVSLSVVKEEKLAFLLQPGNTTKTEIWVTNKIGETKVVSWNMILDLDLKHEVNIWSYVSFLVDEENKVVVSCKKYFRSGEKYLVHVVGEDNKVRHVDLGAVGTSWPFLFNYVPSLIQIQQDVIGGKRKRKQ